jgi:putative DNA-invertase from lambdoid prophage Rac
MHRTMRRAALYMRVSTDEQTTANQRPELEHIAAARGFTVDRVYEEQVSATKHRPMWAALMEGARARRFDALFIWSLDRVGRDMRGNLSAVLELDRLGVQVISVREPWLDTGSPVRDLLVAIFSWVAQQELERLRERTRAGLARARAQGVPLGRPRADRLKLAAAGRLVEEYGYTVRRAAQEAGVGRTTLQRYMGGPKTPPPERPSDPRQLRIPGSAR